MQKQREYKFNRALYAYDTPILFVDAGTQPWRIQYCNVAAAAATGAFTCAFLA